MSVFGKIMSAIFGHGGQTQTAAPTGGSPGTSALKTTTAAAALASQEPVSGASNFDMEAVLNRFAAQKKEKLTWRQDRSSI
jgi:hypothetical protein